MISHLFHRLYAVVLEWCTISADCIRLHCSVVQHGHHTIHILAIGTVVSVRIPRTSERSATAGSLVALCQPSRLAAAHTHQQGVHAGGHQQQCRDDLMQEQTGNRY